MENILHLTVNMDDKKKGDRIPALWTYGSSLVVSSEIDGKWNDWKTIEGKLVEGDWMDFQVKQRRHFGRVRFVFFPTIQLIIVF